MKCMRGFLMTTAVACASVVKAAVEVRNDHATENEAAHSNWIHDTQVTNTASTTEALPIHTRSAIESVIPSNSVATVTRTETIAGPFPTVVQSDNFPSYDSNDVSKYLARLLQSEYEAAVRSNLTATNRTSDFDIKGIQHDLDAAIKALEDAGRTSINQHIYNVSGILEVLAPAGTEPDPRILEQPYPWMQNLTIWAADHLMRQQKLKQNAREMEVHLQNAFQRELVFVCLPLKQAKTFFAKKLLNDKVPWHCGFVEFHQKKDKPKAQIRRSKQFWDGKWL